MKKTIWTLLSTLIVLAFALSACRPATPTAAPDTQVPATEAPTQPPATEAPTKPAIPEMCMGAQPGDELTVMYVWSGAEEEKLNAIFKPLVDTCGIKIVAESTRDAAVVDARVQSAPPDILFWPSTAPLDLYTDKLVPLDTVGGVAENYASYWLDLGTRDGKWLAVPVKADIKSIVWYSPAQFEAFGYTVPTTFEELDALVEKMVADGNVPWSMGLESGPATGWTGSDFIQDILLALQGPEYVSKIISGEIPYNDAGVLQAYQIYYKWASDPKYTVGGAEGTLNTSFLDAIYKPFASPAEAMMVKQSGFAGGEIVKQFPSLVYGTDFDFFPFPGAKGMQGGADFMMVFGTSNATKAMVAYLTGADGAATWAQVGFDLSPNKLAAGKYTDPQLAKKAEILANAAGFTPDIGDTIPAPFGEAEWKAIIEVLQGGDIQAALDKVAQAQAEALKK
ncbi:MAG: ABC transporter substrate-binding protein [Anaerolineales bacterium]